MSFFLSKYLHDVCHGLLQADLLRICQSLDLLPDPPVGEFDQRFGGLAAFFRQPEQLHPAVGFRWFSHEQTFFPNLCRIRLA